jgi:hypothetical protein
MTDIMPPAALPPSHALLVPRPRRWWAIVDVVLFWLLFVAMFLPFAEDGGYRWSRVSDRDPTGWQLAIDVFPILFTLGGMGILFHFELRRQSRFRSPLHAFSAELFRLHLIVFTGLMLGISYEGPLLGEAKPLEGAALGLSALGLMAILQVCRLIAFGGLWRLLRRLYRRPPWKRWNWWLLPTVLGGGLVGIGAILLFVFFANECVREFERVDSEIDVYRGCVMVVFIAFVVLHLLLTSLMTLAMWERRGWAVWVHLFLSSVTLSVIVKVIVEVGDDSGVAIIAWSLLGTYTAFLVYDTVVGLVLSAQWTQRGWCGTCNRVRWMTAAQCDVCGERLWLHKDRAASPVCLACGHESGDVPQCKACRLQESSAGPRYGDA